MKDNPLISVVIPVYKVEKYIRECVDSVLAQTYTNLDIILVDDGSPDECPSICDGYAVRDERVRVVHKPNGGLSSARNAGIDAARGEYITFIDSDDYVSRVYVEQLYYALSESGADMSCILLSQNEKDITNGFIAEYKTYTAESALRKIMMSGLWGPDCKLCRTKIFDEIGIRFPEGMIYEDIAVMFEIIGSMQTIAFSERVNYYYRQTPDSITRSLSLFPEKYTHFYRACSMAEEYFRKNYPQLMMYLKNIYTHFTMYFIKNAIPIRGKYPQVMTDLTGRIRVRDIPRYMLSNSRLINKMAMIVVAFAPKLGVKIIGMTTKKPALH